jgi:hypothetical protein
MATLAMLNQRRAASQLALPCNAYCVCTPSLHFVPLVQNPLRGSSLCNYRRRNLALVPWRHPSIVLNVAATNNGNNPSPIRSFINRTPSQ